MGVQKIIRLRSRHKTRSKRYILCFELKNEDGEGGNLIAAKFNKEACRKAVAKYLVLDELPFRHTEGEGFKQLVHTLQPRFVPVSRTTVARDIYQMYLDEKVSLRNVMSKERISITTDTWTSIQNINYMCVTVHWIDSEWSQITDHKGETIGEEVEACLNDWGIHMLFAVIVENAATNNSAIEYLLRKFQSRRGALILNGEFLRMRCCSHIVNLIVNEGLKEKDYSISSIRNAMKYV